VVGPAKPRERIAPKWRKHFERLSELREYLGRECVNLARDAHEENVSTNTHTADDATDAYDRDLALGMLSAEQDALYEIDEALRRVRDGTYGICEMTRKPIESRRLDAIPWTRFSAAAEKELEARGQFRRARLGSRETVSGNEKAKAPEETE
jgi:DnaK suppressor protein